MSNNDQFPMMKPAGQFPLLKPAGDMASQVAEYAARAMGAEMAQKVMQTLTPEEKAEIEAKVRENLLGTQVSFIVQDIAGVFIRQLAVDLLAQDEVKKLLTVACSASLNEAMPKLVKEFEDHIRRLVAERLRRW